MPTLSKVGTNKVLIYGFYEHVYFTLLDREGFNEVNEQFFAIDIADWEKLKKYIDSHFAQRGFVNNSNG